MSLSNEGSIRLQKFLSEQGICSRRQAEELIAEGRITVNGHKAVIGQKIDPASDHVKVGNRHIRPSRLEHVTLAMNKPKGALCSNEDPHHQNTVFDLLPPELRKRHLFCAGRLDKDSEGLLIITSDGDLSHKLMHPSSQITKRYRVTLTRPYNERHTRRMLDGVEVEGEFLRADKVIPATEGPDANKRLEIHLHQGRKREIRRMLEACGYYVKRLKRFQIGNYVLKGIGPGKYRELGDKEVELLFAKEK